MAQVAGAAGSGGKHGAAVTDATKSRATLSQAYEALRLAQIHADVDGGVLRSSAVACVKDAEVFFSKGMYGFAHAWAVESLRYSVGVFHTSFARARQL